MKQILSTALAVVLFVGAAQAQSAGKDGRHHKAERKEMAMNHLNLTADQKEAFQRIREAQKKEIQELKNSGNVTPEQRKAIHQKYQAQYQAVLTPAQQDDLKKKKEEWKSQGRAGKKGRAFDRGGDIGRQAAFFKKELNLTAGQETNLKSLFEEFQSKSQVIRSNTSLNQEQKRTEVKNLARQYMIKGKALLTPEQQKKLDEMKGKRKGKKNPDV